MTTITIATRISINNYINDNSDTINNNNNNNSNNIHNIQQRHEIENSGEEKIKSVILALTFQI